MSRNVVITGANRGLGLEFVKQYLKDGWKVFACSRSPETSEELLKLKQVAGEQLETIPLDVTKPTHITNLKYTLMGNSIDLLINNAGIYGERLPYGEVRADEWMKVLEVNTVAPMMVVQELSELIVDNGKIILMSSKMGSVADNTSGGSYIYRSSKAALNAVGKSLSHDLAGRSISVAVCHPGWVQTDMGGPNGLIDTVTSITGLRKVIENLDMGRSGQFFNYDGAVIPW
ncbi:short-chain dehydrogenase [Endozoicomonas sp. OPT23]|uniref:SDR family oxidoreductase n=1 Tax=Endozoicomonas sp. OPT23 TaxID=2072845 RepID=UPI00129A32EA|nr:SDR family oxidoreductase [Endozoicomonas sp. OPT23]MRI32172.1 short-chain dehydrogenase [Endozoicomonas sp. OPT23]